MRGTFVGKTVGLILALSLSASEPAKAQDKPTRPADGATAATSEGPRYPHAKVARYEIGQGPRSYWLFEPDEPKPERAPVVVFLHGWFSVNPAIYGAWIDHLVRSGKTVVFPRYQNDVGTLPRDFLPNALFAVRDSLGVLAAGKGHVRPDLDRFALIGHSAGGNLAAQVAAVSGDRDSGLPKVQAVVVVMPGEVLPSREPKLSQIPESTLLTVAVGEDDVVVGDLRARQIFRQATAIPKSRKRFILFRSDRRGVPPLLADHVAPTGANSRLDNGEGLLRTLQLNLGGVNAFDWAGFWRIADVTLAAGFAGLTLDEAITDEDALTHMGYWSDGRRVHSPIISDDPANVPRVLLSNGIKIIPWEWPSRTTDEAVARTSDEAVVR